MSENNTSKAAPNGAAIEAAARKMFRPQSVAAPAAECPPAGKVIPEMESAVRIISELERDDLLSSTRPEQPHMLGQENAAHNLHPASDTVPTVRGRPASPVMVARLCQEAGFPEMTANLLAMPHSRADVIAKLEEATDIATAGRLLGFQATMYRTLAVSGISLQLARKLLFDMKAEMDEAIQIDTSRPVVTSQPRAPAVNSDAVYQQLNGQALKGQR